MKNNIFELIGEIKENDTMEKVSIDALCDYGETRYLCDIITEIADSNVDIYTSDLFEWAKDNYNYIEEANDELGASNDIIQQIQQGQFYQNEQEIYANIEDMIKLYLLNLLKENGMEELTDSQVSIIDEMAHNCYTEDALPCYDDIIDDILENA